MKYTITNLTTNIISIAYRNNNDILRYVDIAPRALLQEVEIDPRDKESFEKSLQFFETDGAITLSKINESKAQTLNNDKESKRVQETTQSNENEIKASLEKFENKISFSINDKELEVGGNKKNKRGKNG